MRNKPFCVITFLLFAYLNSFAQKSKLSHCDSSVRAKAFEIYQGLIKNTADTSKFASIAILYSNDTATAASGGRAERFKLNDCDETIAKTIKKMKPGDISKPIENSQGFYLIRLNNKNGKWYEMQDILLRFCPNSN